MKSGIQALMQTAGLVQGPPATDSDFRKFTSVYGVRLPVHHETLLRWSNGLAVFDGYFRIFGLGPKYTVDALWWNDRDCWKFAWNRRCDDFWCFGETPWGDQYAYRFDDLSQGKDAVYFLDGVSMSAEVIALTFEQFFEKEFLRNASAPYDEMAIKARQKFGPLQSEALLVYSTSLLLGGNEDIENVAKMNARAAMICNGDIATELEKVPDNGQIMGVQPYEDECHRTRIKLLWSSVR